MWIPDEHHNWIHHWKLTGAQCNTAPLGTFIWCLYTPDAPNFRPNQWKACKFLIAERAGLNPKFKHRVMRCYILQTELICTAPDMPSALDKFRDHLKVIHLQGATI